MALLFMDGFDHRTSKGWIPVVAPASVGRNGGIAMFPDASGIGSRIGIPPTARIFVGLAANASIQTFGQDGTNEIALWSDNGTVRHLVVKYSSMGAIELRRGSGAGTVLAVSSARVNNDAWNYLELEATIADAGGIAKVRLNGIEVINFTGDTRNGGTSTNIDAYGAERYAGSGHNLYVDDLYICDDTGPAPFNTFLGDITIPFRLANGNGAVSQWVGSDANSVDNYLLVDEAGVPNTTDYVASDVLGNRDLVTVQDMTTVTGTVLAAQTVVYAAKSDAGAASVKMLQRASTGTVVADAVAQPLSTTYGTYSGEIRLLDPDNTAWTHAKINGLEVGVEVG